MSNIMKKIIWTIIIIALYGIVVLLAKYRPWELSEIRDKYNEAWQCAMDMMILWIIRSIGTIIDG